MRHGSRGRTYWPPKHHLNSPVVAQGFPLSLKDQAALHSMAICFAKLAAHNFSERSVLSATLTMACILSSNCDR
eukprot:scaffold34506_cov31-Tisochrysis_lutea.AAC.3